MKVLWLCNYSLKYLQHQLKIKIDNKSKHPIPWLYYLVQEISKIKDVELHILTLSSDLEKDYYIIEDGIHYHLIKERPFVIPTLKFGSISKRKIHSVNIFWKKKVLKIIEEINPDVINIHGTEGNLQVLGNNFDIPTVVWMQGLMNFVTKYQESSKYKYWLENENKIITHQKHFITFPGEMEQFIKNHNPNAKFYNIYHPNPEYAFDMFNLDITKTSDIIYAAEIVKRKGIEDFIEVTKRLKSKLNIKSKIIGFTGNEEYLKHIKELIKSEELENNIEFVGYVEEHSDVLMEIKKSKILLLPTYVDTGPRAVAESMTIGTPVISYNVDGLPEMIENNASGILVECGNIEKLTNAVEELLTNKKKVNKIIVNAFQIALEKYSPHKVVEQLLQLYSQILKEKSITV